MRLGKSEFVGDITIHQITVLPYKGIRHRYLVVKNKIQGKQTRAHLSLPLWKRKLRSKLRDTKKVSSYMISHMDIPFHRYNYVDYSEVLELFQKLVLKEKSPI